MRQYKMILFLNVLFILVLGRSTEAAGRWIQFENSQSKNTLTSPDISVSVATSEEVVLDITVPGMYVTEIGQEGETYQQISILRSGYTAEVGKPQLPMFGELLAIPQSATVKITVLSTQYEELNDYMIYPAQEEFPDSEETVSIDFMKDEEAYQDDTFYPANTVEVEEPITIRGCSAVILRVYPVQFNAAAGIARVYSHFRIQLSFKGESRAFIEDKFRAPSFDRLLNRLILNYSKNLNTRAKNDLENCLIIITHPNFLSAANALAVWKREKGIQTTVKTTHEIGTTVSSMKSYIQNAYNTWSSPPTHVLLIGDAEFIPCYHQTQHYSSENPELYGKVGTDLYYATVDGSDYFPDLHIGRLSVDTLTEANSRVNRIIRYEKNPPTLSSFYTKAAIAGYFQDTDNYDGVADRRFAQTSEDIALFLETQGYVEQRIYYTKSGVQPAYWSNSYFGGGLAGEPGDSIPTYLKKPGFAWDGDAADISKAIHEGRFLVMHRDHGSSTGWGNPYYTRSYVEALVNGNLLPIIWSIDCSTGWFDNETDDSSTGTSSDKIAFSEAWERNANGGAVGIIAATRLSSSGHNDRLVWGFMDAIWPTFISSYGQNSAEPEYEMGVVLNYGKYYYATRYSESTKRKVHFEMYHWFGDPTTQIWTSVPQTLVVSHPPTLSNGATSSSVTVNTSNAVICMSKNGIILARALSNGGTSTLSWSDTLVEGDEITVTVTKHNYRPYLKTVTVTAGTSILLWTR